MDKIKVQLLNPDGVFEAEKMMVLAARLTQRGHVVNNMDDFDQLYQTPYSADLVQTLAELPHPTLQKFMVINFAVVGASRRFLAQITRHQNEVKFMSASLQYSDYSDKGAFVVPYECLTNRPAREAYLKSCQESMAAYKRLVAQTDNDSAGYAAPQGLRNILIISATPYQWKHMIKQRICRRNTTETRYVMMLIWEQLERMLPEMFGTCGPDCMYGHACPEGRMTCGHAMPRLNPSQLIEASFSNLKEVVND